MIGTVLLGFVLLFALSAVFFDAKGSDRGSRISAILAGLTAVGASAVLFAIILSNDFSYSYVASYSSIDLPLIYKISAFWAGQQGSFLLWLLIHAAVGVCIAQEGRMSAAGRCIYHLLTAMLAVL
ncbi:MAG: cytochrome C biogenesis protein, partial [Selenomonas sp.]|nr:cytochrome C biogenesis protein [Selenomonas sp.]